jgi:catechol 2,3-dioxygenase-like lactoylglutathione lyase family enzyme
MFSHMMVGSNDIDRSKIFYDALFGAVGGKPGLADPHGRLVYLHKNNTFMVTKPIDGAAATIGNGCTIGFAMDNPEQTDAWHKAGTENGGTSIENPPGFRQGSFGAIYLAYLRDPDGNKLCALYRMPRVKDAG